MKKIIILAQILIVICVGLPAHSSEVITGADGNSKATFHTKGDTAWIISDMSADSLKFLKQYLRGTDEELATNSAGGLCLYMVKSKVANEGKYINPDTFKEINLVAVLPNKKAAVLKGTPAFVKSLCNTVDVKRITQSRVVFMQAKDLPAQPPK